MRFDVTARRDKLYTDDREHNPQPSDPQDRLENELFSTLKIISWNINYGGYSTKIKDGGFQTFIQTYDVVLLTECWLEKDYKSPVEEFHCYYFSRKKPSRKGGGYVALVKKKIIKNIFFVKNLFDSIIWLQIQNLLFYLSRMCLYTTVQFIIL